MVMGVGIARAVFTTVLAQGVIIWPRQAVSVKTMPYTRLELSFLIASLITLLGFH
jgi:hypothetical protein